MKCHVYFRYSTPGDPNKRGDWKQRTTYHESLESTMKRVREIIDQEYNGVDPSQTAVPNGLLILYYSSGASENAMPLVCEYNIFLLKPEIVAAV